MRWQAEGWVLTWALVPSVISSPLVSFLRTLLSPTDSCRNPAGIADSGNSGGIRFGTGASQMGIPFRRNTHRNLHIPGMQTGMTGTESVRNVLFVLFTIFRYMINL